jgi:SAM-dependent methyltransferase
MADTPWCDTYYRWNWFRRTQWWPQYREQTTAEGGKLRLLRDLMPPSAEIHALDATCGLGRQTLALETLGVRVTGSDACAYAIGKAEELARHDSSSARFFVSAWRDLPTNPMRQFDVVFVDAFADCLPQACDLREAFAGVFGVLRPGGLFIYPGPAAEETPELNLRRAWEAAEPYYVDWHHVERDLACTCVHTRALGRCFIDEHCSYLISEAGGPPRLESATIRRWMHWTRCDLDDAAMAAGFDRPVTVGPRIVAKSP